MWLLFTNQLHRLIERVIGRTQKKLNDMQPKIITTHSNKIFTKNIWNCFDSAYYHLAHIFLHATIILCNKKLVFQFENIKIRIIKSTKFVIESSYTNTPITMHFGKYFLTRFSLNTTFYTIQKWLQNTFFILKLYFPFNNIKIK